MTTQVVEATQNQTTSSEHTLISFVTPVYNEEHNIGRFLKNLYGVLNKHSHWKYELILIEDGSKDETRSALMAAAKDYPYTQIIFHEKNLGFNRSVRDGIAKSSGKFVMYVGADEEFDSSEIPQFVEPALSGTADVVIGVRWQRNAYKLFRFFLSVIYIFILNYIFRLRVNDYNWSQLWSRDLLNHIQIRSKSLFILPELIIRAFDLGYRVLEIPSNHRGRQHGKSSLNLSIMGHAFWEAFLFCWYRKSRKYTAEKDRHHMREEITTSIPADSAKVPIS